MVRRTVTSVAVVAVLIALVTNLTTASATSTPPSKGWTITYEPQPRPSPVPTFSSVSCWRPNGCFAVGSTSERGDGGSAILRWDGTTWTQLALPTSGDLGTGGILTGVSCAS